MQINPVNSSSAQSPEDALAAFVGALSEVQSKIAQHQQESAQQDLEVAKATEAAQAANLKKEQDQYNAYLKAKEEAESEPAWKRALMGIATLGMSELGPLIENGFTTMLLDCGVHHGPLLTYLSKALTIVAIAALVVAATVVTGGTATVAMAGSEAAGGAVEGAEAGMEMVDMSGQAVDVSAQAADADEAAVAEESTSEQTLGQRIQASMTKKVLTFGVTNGIGSTNLATSIAKDAGANQNEMYAAMALQMAVVLAGGYYGMSGEGSAFGGLANLTGNANGVKLFGEGVQAGSSMAAGGYQAYQAKRALDAAEDLGDLGQSQADNTLLGFVTDQMNSAMTTANASMVAAIKQANPYQVASQITFTVPAYLIESA